MLPKKFRLPSPLIPTTLKKGQRLYGPHFCLISLPNKELHLRFGILVSKKIIKKATERNKLKRKVREIIRSKLEEVNLGYDAIFQLKKWERYVYFRQIRQEIEELFNLAKLS